MTHFIALALISVGLSNFFQIYFHGHQIKMIKIRLVIILFSFGICSLLASVWQYIKLAPLEVFIAFLPYLIVSIVFIVNGQFIKNRLVRRTLNLSYVVVFIVGIKSLLQ